MQKYAALWVFIIGIQTMVFCQKSGIVTFTHTKYLDTNEPLPPGMPSSFSSIMLLNYNATASLYQRDLSVIEDDNNVDQGPRRFQRMRTRNNNILYKNLQQKNTLEQIEFFGKFFLVSDTIQSFPWKISAGEQKTICGKMCMKATYSDSTSKYTVFFTPQIPISTGPDKYGNLPGLILEFQSSTNHILATKIMESDVQINEPTKGDKMDREAFKKLREQKMAEQKEMWGGRNNSNNTRMIRN